MLLDEDPKLEEFLDGLPALFRTSIYLTSPELHTALEVPVKPMVDKLLPTCLTGLVLLWLEPMFFVIL